MNIEDNYQGDLIQDIPYNANDEIAQQDLESSQIVQAIFDDQENVRNFLDSIQDTVLCSILFLIFSSSWASKTIDKIGLTKTHIQNLLFRTLAFAALFFILQRRFQV